MKVVLIFGNGAIVNAGGAPRRAAAAETRSGVGVRHGPGYVTSGQAVLWQDLVTGVVCGVRVGVGRLRPQRHVGLRPR